jgi:hypothetical protein
VCDPYESRLCCVDNQQTAEVEALFSLFMDRWRDPYWRNVISHAVRYYVEANDPSLTEKAIVMGQATLELLSWTVLVERERWIDKTDRLTATARLRLLLKWAGMPTAVPAIQPDLEGQMERRAGEFPKETSDGPKAITLYRNDIVHPKPDGIAAFTGRASGQVWNLMCSYIELVLLRILGHQGGYADRLTRRRRPGDLTSVPWAPDPTAGP